MKSVVIICGMEPIFNDDGSFKLNSETFRNNARTYMADNPRDGVMVLDMREYKDGINPIESVLGDVASFSQDNPLDLFVYNGHSSTSNLLALYHTRGELPDSSRFITKKTVFPEIKFREGGIVELWGCRTCGNYEVDPNSIAQYIANELRIRVKGWICRTSQKQVGSKFYQMPEKSTYSPSYCMPKGGRG
jgi:hypothetical protein